MQEEQPIYTTPEAVAAYLGLDLSGSDLEEAIEESWIIAMSKYADQYTNRTLYRTEETTIKYDGDGSNMMLIKDCVDPTVVLNGTTVTTLYTYPTNKPYASRIRLDEGYKFTKGIQNVEVTGVHAMSIYLPEDIQHAVTILVAGIYLAKDIKGKAGTTERIGNYSITYRTDAEKQDYETAKQILSSYRRIAL